MDWTSILTAVPDAIKGLFGVVDKAVLDKTKADELKTSIVLSYQQSRHWLPANVLSIVLLILTAGMVWVWVARPELDVRDYVLFAVWIVALGGWKFDRNTLEWVKDAWRMARDEKKEASK